MECEEKLSLIGEEMLELDEEDKEVKRRGKSSSGREKHAKAPGAGGSVVNCQRLTDGLVG